MAGFTYTFLFHKFWNFLGQVCLVPEKFQMQFGVIL